MPQPNKGKAGSAHVAQPIDGRKAGAGNVDKGEVKTGVHVTGIKGK